MNEPFLYIFLLKLRQHRSFPSPTRLIDFCQCSKQLGSLGLLELPFWVSHAFGSPCMKLTWSINYSPETLVYIFRPMIIGLDQHGFNLSLIHLLNPTDSARLSSNGSSCDPSTFLLIRTNDFFLSVPHGQPPRGTLMTWLGSSLSCLYLLNVLISSMHTIIQ